MRTRGAAVAWVVVAMGGTAAVVAQSQEELDREIQRLTEVSQDPAKLVREIVQSLTDIEGENKARVKKLGEADERRRAEQARADALERELARLAGKEIAPGPGKEPGSSLRSEPGVGGEAVGLPMVRVPGRRVNGLGLVEVEQAVLAGADPRCDGVRFAPLAEAATAGGELAMETSGREVRFLRDDGGLGARVLLATLRLEDGRVWWSWAGSVSSKAKRALETLDRWLATGVIEATAQGEVVGRWQVEPVTVRVAMSSEKRTAVAAPEWATGLRLELTPIGGAKGWLVEARSASSLRMARRDAVMAVDWDAEAGEVTVDRHVIPGGVDAVMDQQIEVWEKDLKALRDGDSPNKEREIKRTERELARLREARETVAGMSPGTGGGAGVTVGLVASNGVVCARYEIGS